MTGCGGWSEIGTEGEERLPVDEAQGDAKLCGQGPEPRFILLLGDGADLGEAFGQQVLLFKGTEKYRAKRFRRDPLSAAHSRSDAPGDEPDLPGSLGKAVRRDDHRGGVPEVCPGIFIRQRGKRVRNIAPPQKGSLFEEPSVHRGKAVPAEERPVPPGGQQIRSSETGTVAAGGQKDLGAEAFCEQFSQIPPSSEMAASHWNDHPAVLCDHYDRRVLRLVPEVRSRRPHCYAEGGKEYKGV